MGVSAAIDLLLALLSQSTQISALIQKATAAGRTTLTADEWQTILDADTSARAALAASIAAAK